MNSSLPRTASSGRLYARLAGLAGLLVGLLAGAALGAAAQWMVTGGFFDGLSLGLLAGGLPLGFVLSSALARRAMQA